MRYTLLLLAMLSIFNYACKKEKEEKYCWQIIDHLGNEMGTVCDKTEAELLACASNGTCGINGSGFSSCNYYKVEGEEFCWLIDNSYMIKATENKLSLLKRCFNTSANAVKVDCNYCMHWYHREKRTYKPDNKITYSKITRELFCGDTARTLYQGRQVIIKNDADSLIVIQFSQDGASW